MYQKQEGMSYSQYTAKQMQFNQFRSNIQGRHHMQHATTYDTVKLKQAPAMLVYGEWGHQLQSYVDSLHRMTLHSSLEHQTAPFQSSMQTGATALFSF
jgi:hypothetical protein